MSKGCLAPRSGCGFRRADVVHGALPPDPCSLSLKEMPNGYLNHIQMLPEWSNDVFGT